METTLLTEIESLRRASLARLRERYEEVFEEQARSRHREHLFRRIAWRLQALAEGDLSERARNRAAEIARDADLRIVAPRGFFTVGEQRVETLPANRNGWKHDQRLPIPGTLLSREWKQRRILVEVLEEGFRYENRHYASLSAIASEITGTRWNGLAFFGLKGETSRGNATARKQRKEKPRAEK
jgi:Protein of unknown function (DUF2924)